MGLQEGYSMDTLGVQEGYSGVLESTVGVKY